MNINYELNNFAEQTNALVLYSYPSANTSWSAGVVNHNDHDLVFNWWAVCAIAN